MISISRLLCDTISPGDSLRYGEKAPHTIPFNQSAGPPRPVVVWNCTRQCNLHCLHCYASAGNQKLPGELSTAEGQAFIRGLGEFGVPVILFSGGEPLLREDLFALADFATRQGIRVALSTNGTMITGKAARKLKSLGFAEVGISLDGIGEKNDRFRGLDGAYEATLQGIRRCIAVGLRVSLRLTITSFNYREIPAIFRLAEEEGIDRLCFYHLAYSGRGDRLRDHDISHEQTRAVVDVICHHTRELYARGLAKEVLTVGNHADGIYLYLKLKKEDPERAVRTLALLRTNGGNSSGIKIGAVDNRGNVHPDQFWWHYSLGNIHERSFGDIWSDTAEPVLGGLRNRKALLKGRCARCHYLDLCNGNLRVRAEAVFGDVWAEDPACYLTEAEISNGRVDGE
ncbi:MAG: radical SAM protein [Chloroflexi bacterium]|nr:radical SAM protein [Chloroflexota bacterium]